MRDDNTPTTEQVRAHYVFDQTDHWNPARGKAFDRWLTAHDAEVTTEVTNQVAGAIPVDLWATYGILPRESVLEIQKWIKERGLPRRASDHATGQE